MRFFRARPEGVNVYIYKVGSTTANYLAGLTPSQGRVTEDDPVTLYDSAGVPTTNGWDDLEIVFWGGTNAVDITASQAAALVSAGYTITS